MRDKNAGTPKRGCQICLVVALSKEALDCSVRGSILIASVPFYAPPYSNQERIVLGQAIFYFSSKLLFVTLRLQPPHLRYS